MGILSGTPTNADLEPDRQEEAKALEKAEGRFNEECAKKEKDFERLLFAAASCAVCSHNCYWPLLATGQYERALPFVIRMEHYTKQALTAQQLLAKPEGK